MLKNIKKSPELYTIDEALFKVVEVTPTILELGVILLAFNVTVPVDKADLLKLNITPFVPALFNVIVIGVEPLSII